MLFDSSTISKALLYDLAEHVIIKCSAEYARSNAT